MRFIFDNTPIWSSFATETPDGTQWFVAWWEVRARNNGDTVIVEEILNFPNHISLKMSLIRIFLHGTIVQDIRIV